MPLGELDFQVLLTLARYYVLTREQIQAICAPSHASGRSTRKRLTRLRQAGLITKHAVLVVLPSANGAAPVYYLTKAGAEALAAYFDDERLLATNTKQPRADRLSHWVAISDVRMVIEAAIATQQRVRLEGWFTEWQTINPDANEKAQFVLHTQLSTDPPLSCSPDAAFLLSVDGHKKVFYVEVDLGTSSPKQIAARKSKGYATLAEIQHHRVHFPATTFATFSVLMITTNAYRCRATQRAMKDRPGAALWRYANRDELTPETFLHSDMIYDHDGNLGPLVKRSNP